MESYTAILHSGPGMSLGEYLLPPVQTFLSQTKFEGDILRSLYNVWFSEVGSYRVNVWYLKYLS